ncbi:MAG: DsrE family protein [Spirochaetota bacterium]|nr:MAG: DsrE family protein [Spirochaetota bacterium]
MANYEKSLVVIWSSGDREVALKAAFMYTFNAKKQGWWEDVILIVWGPSAKLLSEDSELQEYVEKMKDIGVVVEACKACSDMYGVSGELVKLGVDVKYMGIPLTSYIKDGGNVISF